MWVLGGTGWGMEEGWVAWGVRQWAPCGALMEGGSEQGIERLGGTRRGGGGRRGLGLGVRSGGGLRRGGAAGNRTPGRETRGRAVSGARRAVGPSSSYLQTNGPASTRFVLIVAHNPSTRATPPCL